MTRQTRYAIPELPGAGRLGRHVEHDRRSERYKAATAPAIASVRHASRGLPLNQGSVGSCTAEALTGCLNTLPDLPATATPRTQADAYALYGAEVALEGMCYPPQDPGGTGLTVCKAAKNLGLISSYAHAFSADDALKALTLAPVMFGVNWYDSMDVPDENGLLTITEGATVRGGHEVFADEIDAANELIGFWNSWGTGWGLGGRFYLSFATCERLLGEDGDVTVPTR